ncbi:hypothetical protein BGW38_002622, partial [Lunasporangiospora selenospora]
PTPFQSIPFKMTIFQYVKSVSNKNKVGYTAPTLVGPLSESTQALNEKTDDSAKDWTNEKDVKTESKVTTSGSKPSEFKVSAFAYAVSRS